LAQSWLSHRHVRAWRVLEARPVHARVHREEAREPALPHVAGGVGIDQVLRGAVDGLRAVYEGVRESFVGQLRLLEVLGLAHQLERDVAVGGRAPAVGGLDHVYGVDEHVLLHLGLEDAVVAHDQLYEQFHLIVRLRDGGEEGVAHDVGDDHGGAVQGLPIDLRVGRVVRDLELPAAVMQIRSSNRHLTYPPPRFQPSGCIRSAAACRTAERSSGLS
jgi:hypothetical protein